ncbi:hypothetical protein AC1031_005227 [Aphanomyces cochlioides]|nr:hypothetical protein AC1031_005227 [Aphanomyces cochlioides]
MQARKSYAAELARFKSFLARGDEHESNLVDVVPEDVCRYFNFKAYGEEFPSETSRPQYARSNTLKASKKMLSCFMPRRNMPWDEVKREGNPTRSILVNDLIKRIMKFEVRQQGVESQARRPIDFSEFLNVLSVIRSDVQCDMLDRYRLSSILTLQWHLIGRVDDMMKLQFRNFSFMPAYPFTLICQMRWSKNISEERESPHQIMLGSMDERLCVLLNLAVYLELIEDDSIVDEKFLFGNGVDGDRSVRDLLRTALENSAFKKILDGNLGTHSIRKGPATYCARNGVSRENIELRGRCRGYKKQVDTYIDIDRPLPDAQVASCLCGPSGAIMYCVDKVNWCSDVFLCDKIAPNVAKCMSPQVATVLAKPLLNAAVQRTSRLDSNYPLMPETLRQRILNHILVAGSYASLNDITQFVDRIPIAVSGFGGELNIDQIGLENVSPFWGWDQQDLLVPLS